MRAATPLALVALYDELWSGVAVVGAPDVEDAHGLGHAACTLWVFAVPLLLASLIEVPLALIALVIAAATPLPMALALVVLGAAAAPHYPLLQAAAYDLVPHRLGLVNAASQAFVVLEVLLPLAVGVIAARAGTAVALASLAVQPVFVIAVALAVPRRPPAARPAASR